MSDSLTYERLTWDQLAKASLTKAEAKEAGYQALTIGYWEDERWMLDSVIADMCEGNIDFVTVIEDSGHHIQVWRKSISTTTRSKEYKAP